MKKRILSIVLSILMLVSLVPTMALAYEAPKEDTHSSHRNCGVANCNAGHGCSDEGSWTAWDGTDVDTVEANIQLPDSENVYLTQDVQLNDIIVVNDTVNFCLNGHKIESNSIIFTLSNEATLNICDCSKNKTGELETTTGSYAVYLDLSTAINLYSGTITSSGYGIHSDKKQTSINVYGGTITSVHNGIYNLESKSTVNIYDGEITSTGSHDAVFNSAGTLTISNGTIKSQSSAGISTYSGNIIVSGGNISGLYGIKNQQGTVTVSDDANISGTNSGIINSKTLIIRNGTISGGDYGIQNYSDYYNENRIGNIELSGAPVITGTMADIYLVNNKVINISGALTYGAANAISVKMDSAGTFTTGWTTMMGENADYDSYFTSASSVYAVQPNGNGELKLVKKIAVTGVMLNKTETTIGTGKTEILVATVKPDNATDKSVTWSSDNKTVASVDQTGKVTAKSKGTATITATAADGSGNSATCNVTVLETITGPIEINFNPLKVGETFNTTNITNTTGNYEMLQCSISPASSICAGETFTVSVIFKPASGYCFDSDLTVAEFNGEPATITIDDNGTVTFSRSYTFDASSANSIEIYKVEDEVTTTQSIILPGMGAANETATFTAKVQDQYEQEMNNQTVNWSIVDSSDQTSDEVTVENGVVTVKAGATAGDYTLTATCGEKSDSITIKVEKAESILTTVKIFDGNSSDNELTIVNRPIPDVGSTSYINSVAKGYDQYAEEMNGLTFTWSNTNKDSEINLDNGNIEIKSGAQDGSFNYTASCNGKSATVTVYLTKIIYTVTYTDNVANEIVFSDVPMTVQSGGKAPVYLNGTPSRTCYTFAGWYTSTDGGTTLSDTAYNFDSSVTENITLYAKWTPNTYNVKFNANGGEGVMADQSFTYDEEQALTSNGFTYAEHNFVGWSTSEEGSVEYIDSQNVMNLTEDNNGVVTLYAQWSENPVLRGTITVTDAIKVTANLYGLDGTKYVADIIGDSSPYNYKVSAPSGSYQLVVTAEVNGEEVNVEEVTITFSETLDGNKVHNIELPGSQRNSVVDRTAAGEFKNTQVDGLDEIASRYEFSSDSDENKVEIKLTITEKDDVTGSNEPENEDLKQEQNKIKETARGNYLVFFDLTLTRMVSDGSTSESADIGNANTKLLKIVIPFEKGNKQNITIYRYHDDGIAPGVDIFTENPGNGEEGFIVNDNSITLYAKKFSTYAIGYSIPSGGSYAPSYNTKCDKCDICGGCTDANCADSKCTDKCLLLGMDFTDVAEGKWYTDAVEYVYHRGMMNGVSDDVFDISGTTDRAMIVTILWRLEGSPMFGQGKSGTFADVPEYTWYTEAVEWAAAKGVVDGYGNGNFGPEDNITRQQLAAILWRYAKYKGYDVSEGEDTNILSYVDAFDISEYAMSAMQWACGDGIMTGKSADTLDPRGNATRAEAATMMMRFCENIVI